MVFGRLKVVLGFAVSALWATTASGNGPERFEYTQLAMGVRARVVVYAEGEGEARAAAKAAFERIAAIEEEISDYRTDNPLAKLHATAGDAKGMVVSELFADVLKEAINISAGTGGTFDPALGGPVQIWRSARKSGKMPESTEIEAARLAAGLDNVEFNPRTRRVTLKQPGTKLDFGGIGKGYAAQKASESLKARGITSHLVALAGDVVLGDAPPAHAGWHVAIEGLGGTSLGSIELANCAVSTSGDTAQFAEIEGVRYSHIVNPTTGLGLTTPVVATVIASTGTLADALSTAAAVGGRERILAYEGARARVERAGATIDASADFPQIAAPDDLAERLKWFQHDRFGMFIHWGLYAIPAGEWDGKPVGGTGEWIMHNAKIPPAEYEPLAAQFNPVKFDAKAWVAAAKDAGMKYVVTTTKHHDGFSLFDTAHSTYDIMDASPFKRDIMKELADEIHAQGLKLGWYHSIWDWHHPDGKGARFPVYAKVLKDQVGEILTKYGQVDVVWFDGEWTEEWTEEQGVELYAYCRSLQPKALINNRVGKGRDDMRGLTKGRAVGDFGTPEQQVPGKTVTSEAWESCMTMNDTWGFRKDDHNWKSSDQLIRTLIDSVSKGGNYLLNVGPTADGLIPQESLDRLAAIGAWMRVNGDSIYGCAQAATEKSPAWGRLTRNGNRLFVHIFEWPKDGRVVLKGLEADLSNAKVLGQKAPAIIEKVDGEWTISAPEAKPHTASTVIELKVDGDVHLATPMVRLGDDGVVRCKAADATVNGTEARFEAGAHRNCIGFWTNAADSVEWMVEVPRTDGFTLTLEFACEKPSEGSKFVVHIGEQQREFVVPSTGNWGKFEKLDLGTFPLEAGPMKLKVVPLSKPGYAVMNLREIAFTVAPGVR